ncbi:MAG: mannosyltransferase family protein [Chloroflexota bacterium]
MMQAVQDVSKAKTISEKSKGYQWLLVPLSSFVVTRLIVLIAAYLTEVAIPGMTGDGLYRVNPNNIFLDVWARWDSGFYLTIIESGYEFIAGQQSNVAFFPLYPLLVNLLSTVTGDVLLAGVLVSNACLLGALIFLYRLTAFEFDDETAGRTVFYIAAFPTAFFFSAVYTESTFLLFSVGAFYFARKGEWGWASVMGMLCAGSRIVGVISFGVIGLEWLRLHGWTFSTMHKIDAWKNMGKAIWTDWANLLVIFFVPMGLISYMVFLYVNFNDPIAFSTVQSAWGREQIGAHAVLWRDLRLLLSGDFLRGDIWYLIGVDLVPALLVLASLVWMWRRLGESYAILSALSILIPMNSGTQSLSRYVLVVFPFFMLLGYLGRYKLIDRTLMILFSVFLGVFTGLFVNWIFIA